MKKCKKKILFSALLMLVVSHTMAQTDSVIEQLVEDNTSKYKVEMNRFKDNWFVSIAAGTQFYIGDDATKIQSHYRFSPELNIAFGKWFSPDFGARVMYDGWVLNQYIDVPNMSHSKRFKYTHLQGNMLMNLSNLIAGYNEKRSWSLTPYVGLGVMYPSNDMSQCQLTASFGFLNSFRLSSAWDFNIDLHASAFSDATNGVICGKPLDGKAGITFGFTYKFKRRGWSRVANTTAIVQAFEGEMNVMRDRLKDLNTDVQRLREDSVKIKGVLAPVLIIFPIGKTVLNGDARVNIGFAAKYIKEAKNGAVYTVTGYADRNTGSAALNRRLSLARAQKVFDCLVNEHGVHPLRLEINAEGGVGNMFYNDPRLSRSVIISIKE